MAVITLVVYAQTDPVRPQQLQLASGKLAKAAVFVVRDILFLALLIWIVLLVCHKTRLAPAFFEARTTWYAVAAIGLAINIPGLPSVLRSGTDVVGAVSPRQSLRLDRQADLIVTVSRRVLFAVVLFLFSGGVLTLPYLFFAAAATAVGFVLGGASIASRSYTDARFWLLLTRRMPWSPMNALADAERRGVFQEVGALYRFRHSLVQEQLRDSYNVYRLDPQYSLALLRRIFDEVFGTDEYVHPRLSARRRVEGYRSLAAQNFSEFGPDLAGALWAEAKVLRQRGYREEELNALAMFVSTKQDLLGRRSGDRRGPRLVTRAFCAAALSGRAKQ